MSRRQAELLLVIADAARELAMELGATETPAETDRAAAARALRQRGLLTKAQLAASLNRSEPTVERWLRAGLPHDDLGGGGKLFDLEACRAWLTDRSKQSRPSKPPTLARVELADPLAGVELRSRRRA